MLCFAVLLSGAAAYKTFCMEIGCGATSYGSLTDVKVWDQVVIKNKDKVAHKISCVQPDCPTAFSSNLQVGGSFILNSSVAGTFVFKNADSSLTGTILVSWLVPVGERTIKVSQSGFQPAVLDIVPGDTVTVVVSNSTELHGIRSEATATDAEGAIVDRIVGGTSLGATNVLGGLKRIGAVVKFFDPKFPANRGVINIKAAPDNRPAEPDNVGCTRDPPCGVSDSPVGGGPATTPGGAPGAPNSVPGASVSNPPAQTIDCSRGCNNAVIAASGPMQKCMLGCSTPTPISGPFDCDGMKCFVYCSAQHECSECASFVSAKCMIAINPAQCDVDCSSASTLLAGWSTLLVAVVAAVAAAVAH